MDNLKMPVVFFGHGSPMIAIEDNKITREFNRIGKLIKDKYGMPKAILSISAHWYTDKTLIQSVQRPKQIYDMYGFPKELYELKYEVDGNSNLTNRVIELLGDKVKVDDNWGIDHGTWSVLNHVFPKADIPIVQISVNGAISTREIYEIGEKLSVLREEGFLIIGSGNLVHNLRLVEWGNEGGTKLTEEFNKYIVDNVVDRNDDIVVNYKNIENYLYSIPSPDHFLPIIYILGATKGEKPLVFNNICNLGTISMTGFAFGL